MILSTHGIIFLFSNVLIYSHIVMKGIVLIIGDAETGESLLMH